MNVTPNDYTERDAKTWNDPLATEFIERIRKEQPDCAKLLEAWTENPIPFNGPARHGNPTAEESQRIKQLSALIDTFEVPDNVRMYRSTSRNMLTECLRKGILFEEGNVVTLAGFTSVSATKEANKATIKNFEQHGAKMTVEIEFFVPRGAKAIPISQASKPSKHTGEPRYEFQKEWLLQKDTKVLVLEKRQ